jgi:hypothetical protein
MGSVTSSEVAWKLYREGPGRHHEATELAVGIVGDDAASADEIARAGTLLFAAGLFADAERARTAALTGGAAPVLLAYLDTACWLRAGDGRAARSALRLHLSAASDPLHADMPWLAAQVGSPVLALRAARRAGMSRALCARYVAEAAFRRAPRRACNAALCSR